LVALSFSRAVVIHGCAAATGSEAVEPYKRACLATDRLKNSDYKNVSKTLYFIC
jgi:hypothetical protein